MSNTELPISRKDFMKTDKLTKLYDECTESLMDNTKNIEHFIDSEDDEKCFNFCQVTEIFNEYEEFSNKARDLLCCYNDLDISIGEMKDDYKKILIIIDDLDSIARQCKYHHCGVIVKYEETLFVVERISVKGRAIYHNSTTIDYKGRFLNKASKLRVVGCNRQKPTFELQQGIRENVVFKKFLKYYKILEDKINTLEYGCQDE